MSQTLLASVLESHVPHVSRIERGHAITVDTLFRYAEGLGTTSSALLAVAEQVAADESPDSLFL